MKKFDSKFLAVIAVLVAVVLYLLFIRKTSGFGPTSYIFTNLQMPPGSNNAGASYVVMSYQNYKNSLDRFISNVASINLAPSLSTDTIGLKTIKTNVNNSANNLSNAINAFQTAHNALMTFMNPHQVATSVTITTLKTNMTTALNSIELAISQLTTFSSLVMGSNAYPPDITARIKMLTPAFNELKSNCIQYMSMYQEPPPAPSPSPSPSPPPLLPPTSASNRLPSSAYAPRAAS
jgi:hypothetical protein